jgi:hypothetical protein
VYLRRQAQAYIDFDITRIYNREEFEERFYTQTLDLSTHDPEFDLFSPITDETNRLYDGTREENELFFDIMYINYYEHRPGVWVEPTYTT